MQRRPRRNHTAAFKAKVALAAIKGDRTLAQPHRKYNKREYRTPILPKVPQRSIMCRVQQDIRARRRRWCSTRTTAPSPSSGAPAGAASTTIYGRLPPQGDSVAVGGIGCTNLSGLLLERSCSGP